MSKRTEVKTTDTGYQKFLKTARYIEELADCEL
jgi:hypothetical protein